MPARLPWPKMPKQPAKNGCSIPSRSTYCRARNSMIACAVVLRSMVLDPPARQRVERAPAVLLQRLQGGCNRRVPMDDPVDRERDGEWVFACARVEHVAPYERAADGCTRAQAPSDLF